MSKDNINATNWQNLVRSLHLCCGSILWSLAIFSGKGKLEWVKRVTFNNVLSSAQCKYCFSQIRRTRTHIKHRAMQFYRKLWCLASTNKRIYTSDTIHSEIRNTNRSEIAWILYFACVVGSM